MVIASPPPCGAHDTNCRKQSAYTGVDGVDIDCAIRYFTHGQDVSLL